MIAKLLLQNLIVVVGMGTLLFAAAGTFHWPSAWTYLIVSALLGPACGLWLARTNPGLLAERLKLTAAEQPAADKRFMLVFMLVILSWFVLMGLDWRMRASSVPFALQMVGLAMFFASTGFIMWVFHENSFAAPVVKLQAERHQQVISTGPYAYVRHPMYAGVMFYFIGIPLLLGSWWGIAMVPIFFVLFATRSRIEERTLVAGLPGYADYMSRVRYRLLPGLW